MSKLLDEHLPHGKRQRLNVGNESLSNYHQDDWPLGDIEYMNRTAANTDPGSTIKETKRKQRCKMAPGEETTPNQSKTTGSTASEVNGWSARRPRNPPISGWKFLPPTYRPDQSTPTPLCMLPANSSPRVKIINELVINPRGYNLARASFPAQWGNWYYEVTVTHAPKIIEGILAACEQEGTTNSKECHLAQFTELTDHIGHSRCSETNDTTTHDSAHSSHPTETPNVTKSDESNQANSTTHVEPSVNDSLTTSESPPYSSLLIMLQEMNQLMDSSNRSMPPPHWRLGWATEMADNDCPVGTDTYGYGWCDDGTIFHAARPYPYVPGMKQPKNSRYQVGDVLGFGIVLPKAGLKFVYQLWCHHQAQKRLQDKLCELWGEWLDLHVRIHYVINSVPQQSELEQELKSKYKEVEERMKAIKPLDAPQMPPAVEGTKIYFWKNGERQEINGTDLPPGAYYPAVSLYYQAGVIVNFGPNFQYPPPPEYRPCSELPEAYELPQDEGGMYK